MASEPLDLDAMCLEYGREPRVLALIARLRAAEAAREEIRESEPDIRSFVRWCAEQVWEGYDIDGGSVQDKLEELGVLKRVEFDPEVHDDRGYGLEPGDPYLILVVEEAYWVMIDDRLDDMEQSAKR